MSENVRVIRRKPGLLTPINGVKFEPHTFGSISEQIPDRVAQLFLRVPGYEIELPATPPAPISPATPPAPPAAAEAAPKLPLDAAADAPVVPAAAEQAASANGSGDEQPPAPPAEGTQAPATGDQQEAKTDDAAPTAKPAGRKARAAAGAAE